MGREDSQLWTMVHEARRLLADDLMGLSEEAWRRQSLCSGWTVEQVLAHLTAGASIGRWRWLASIVAAGFRPEVHNAKRLLEYLGPTPKDTLDRFEVIINAEIAPTGDTAAYLGEVMVHGADIRRPLSIAAAVDVDVWSAVAEFYARRDFTVSSKTLVRGLSLEADDGLFRAGSGPRVTGTTMALVMAMAGRREYLDELNGPGRDALCERIGPA